MNVPGKSLFAALLGVAFIFGANSRIRAADDPFAWPPITAQTKPWAYNWWMGSAVDKTNLTKELERYAAAGLGGIHIIPIYGAKGFEDKYINYLSPQWMDMMGWAVSEAHRLGMGVDMTTGSGWCFGGPQVTDEDANASVVVKTYSLKAGEKLNQKFNRESTQALVAFSPDGKSVELTDKISGGGGVDWVVPNATVGQASRLSAAEGVSPSNSIVPPLDRGRDARSNQAGGTPAPLSWTIYAISQKPSGQKVKRAGPGGEGWMLNLIYPPAMDDFLKPFTAAFANYHGPKPRAQYHDSYEYRSDWSPDFFAQFEKRRGYKLQTELPALFGNSQFNNSTNEQFNDHRARVLCDYRQTVSEIMAEESIPKWVKWSHDHGFLTRNEAHGSPGNWLDLYAAADIPETEMFHTDRNKLISKFASSAAHVAGHPLAAAETGTWLEEHFTEKLSDVKYLFDDMFLSGINHIFYHGCCYSPDEAGWPGWHFYASLEMNPRNSIWRDANAVNAYAARVQSILQSGQPDNDVLLYWPMEDFWMQPGDKLLPQLTVHARDWLEGQPIGRTAKELWEKGYAFDYVSDAQLKTAKVADGQFQMPGGNYKVIVVPECKYIPLETFKQLVSAAKQGATVIFETMPSDVSGLANLENQKAEFQKMVAGIKFKIAGKALDGADVGKGHFFVGWKRGPLENSIHPEPSSSQPGLMLIRRRTENGHDYFIGNRGDKNFEGWLPIASSAKSIVILDPLSGRTGIAKQRLSPEAIGYWSGLIEVYVQLAAGESVILRAFADKKVEGPAWNYWQTNGQPIEITGPWNVKFLLGGPTLPADFQTAQLASWTTFPDTNTQAFAGTAKYEITFDEPQNSGNTAAPQSRGNVSVANHTSGNIVTALTDDGLPAAQLRQKIADVPARRTFEINLGDVRQSARVKVNGKDYGTLITPPFRVVVDNLKPVGNTLEVEVTSVAANRIRDLDRRGVPWKTFHDINIVDINYKPFDASQWPLTDCGLLGPVALTLVTAK